MPSIFMKGLPEQMSKENEYNIEAGDKSLTYIDDESSESLNKTNTSDHNDGKQKLRQQRGISFKSVAMLGECSGSDDKSATTQSTLQRRVIFKTTNESNGFDIEDTDDNGSPKPKDSIFRDESASSILVPSLVYRKMKSFKNKANYEMEQDIYAFIVAAPVMSTPFLFACYVIATKYIVFSTLLWGFKNHNFEGTELPATVVKFFLIPVAVAMQGDLMAVYGKIANVQYNPKVLTINAYAKRWKFNLAFCLRIFDGVLSLTANFLTMLKTDEVLGVCLNFAALHFLQDIDDVFYTLVEQGFFGDKIEHMSLVCKKITWKRRVGKDDAKFLGCLRISHLDTILYLITCLFCLGGYSYVTVNYVRGVDVFISDGLVNTTINDE